MYAGNKLWYLEIGRRLALRYFVRVKETKGIVAIIEEQVYLAYQGSFLIEY